MGTKKDTEHNNGGNELPAGCLAQLSKIVTELHFGAILEIRKE